MNRKDNSEYTQSQFPRHRTLSDETPPPPPPPPPPPLFETSPSLHSPLSSSSSYSSTQTPDYIQSVDELNIMAALEILGANPAQIVTLAQLKQMYYKRALKIHPDKNPGLNATRLFTQLTDAYEYAYEYISRSETEEEKVAEEIIDESRTEHAYYNLIDKFIGSICGKQNSIYAQTLSQLIRSLVSNIPEITHAAIEMAIQGTSRESCIELYTTICKYQTILHIRPETIEMIGATVREKYDTVQAYILTPTMDDLFNHRVYSLYIDGVASPLAVPLWNTELYFDGKTPDHEVIVMCNPMLPENVTMIDENNHIYCSLVITDAAALFIQTYMYFSIGSRTFSIPVWKLHICASQIYVLKHEGISKICEKDPCFIGAKGDIVVHITIQ